MNDLFEAQDRAGPKGRSARTKQNDRPLADRLRPDRLEDIVGQEAIFAEGAPLKRMLARQKLASIILWGPPGCGKTTLARLLAGAVVQPLMALSAVMSGVADLRKSFDEARKLRAGGAQAILFIDEIHRFNKAQQDGLLHEVEDGTIVLIGATTENPSFALTGALISRCHVIVLDRLGEAALLEMVERAEAHLCRTLPLNEAARARLVELADGDGRYLLNMVENVADLRAEPVLDVEGLAVVLQQRLPIYDKQEEAHYNLISALHKSVRGSDPDATLYWLARMFQGGEDPRYIARRIVRMANEDIGLADPRAIEQALAATRVYEQLGSPEGELALAQAAVYMAMAPKSNAVYTAFKGAMADAQTHGSLMPPAHIRNAPTKLMKQLGYGAGYNYDHDAPERFSGQNYFPDEMPRAEYYRPTTEGAEAKLRERLERFKKLREARQGPSKRQVDR